MNGIDIFILLAVAALVVFAIRVLRGRSRKGSSCCGCPTASACSGSCGCRKKAAESLDDDGTDQSCH